MENNLARKSQPLVKDRKIVCMDLFVEAWVDARVVEDHSEDRQLVPVEATKAIKERRETYLRK